MADNSPIEWTDATWNPIAGCTIVSPGCTNCYAMRQAARIERMAAGASRFSHYEGLTVTSKVGAVWTGRVALAPDNVVTQPLRWKRPRKIFVNSMSDLFHEAVPDVWIDRIFAVIALCPQHTFQVLTKRPERMREYLRTSFTDLRRRWAYAFEPGAMPITAHEIEARLSPTSTPEQRWLYRAEIPTFPLPNVWLGVSCENQRRADERVPILLDTPAAIRWVSAEPLLGQIDFRQWLHDYGCGCGWGGNSPLDYCRECGWRGFAPGKHVPGDCPECGTPIEDYQACPECDGHDDDGLSFGPNSKPRIDWIVAGGESGPNARPMHPDWVRRIRDDCATAGVAFNFKQWGNWIVASHDNGHHDSSMVTNDAIWLDVDGRQAKPSCEGMSAPIGMFKVSKARSGRLLDGIEHNSFPEVS